jgi:hypothetical protein
MRLIPILAVSLVLSAIAVADSKYFSEKDGYEAVEDFLSLSQTETLYGEDEQGGACAVTLARRTDEILIDAQAGSQRVSFIVERTATMDLMGRIDEENHLWLGRFIDDPGQKIHGQFGRRYDLDLDLGQDGRLIRLRYTSFRVADRISKRLIDLSCRDLH